ncbi:ABC transporter permease [Candidatus Saccharibacteria bacterium]|nr:ABC transporter permease [Candidatus Saccharibacteria bacterium]MBP9131896.1 ABC transporter permease [Candidatus Saccharibacteria bacterium]
MIIFNLKIAVTSILANKVRSLLTVMGVVIGISSVVTVLAIGQGFQTELSKEIDSLGVDLLTIGPSDTGSLFSPKEVQNLKKLSNVKTIAPSRYVPASVNYEKKTDKTAYVLIADSNTEKVINDKLKSGSFYTNSQGDVAVIGADLEKNLFGKSSGLGETVDITYKYLDPKTGADKVKKLSVEIVGVIKSPEKQSTFGLSSQYASSLLIPEPTGAKLLETTLSFDSISVKVENADKIKDTSNQAKKILEKTRGKDDFSIASAEDVADSFTGTLKNLTKFVSAIAAISLLVGGVGIMNIMLSSVAERTHEIGIRKAIGASKRVILSQFLIEALLLSMTGGILGIFTAFLMAHIAGKQIDVKPTFTIGSFIISIGISLFIGVVFGLAPAIRASKMKPIDALRHN